MRLKIAFTLTLFTIETLFQSLYLSITLKYFDEFSGHDTFSEIFRDITVGVVQVKAIFFLPVYLIAYSITLVETKAIQRSAIHALLFLGLFLAVSMLLPGEMAKRVVDTLMLSLIAFGSSFAAIYLTRGWVKSDKSRHP